MIVLARDLWARAQEVFSLVELRMYLAAVIGRTELRAPFGARRSVPLPFNRPTQLAKNTSRDRALLVDVTFVGAAVILADSPNGGSTNQVLDQNLIGVPSSLFVLRPDEQLFATAQGVASSAIIGQEWY